MEDIATLPTKPDTTQKDISLESIISLKLKDLSSREIGKILGCSKTNINERLNSVGFTRQRLDDFKKSRADIQTFVQALIGDKQLEFLASDKSNIQTWKDYQHAQISKATEQDKEQIIVNLKQDNSVNINALIQTVQQYDKVLSGVEGVKVVDDVDNLCKDDV